VGFKLAEGKGLREGWDSKELWKTVERSEAPFPEARKMGPRNSNLRHLVATRQNHKNSHFELLRVWFPPLDVFIRLD
jgi:hypothetical protein